MSNPICALQLAVHCAKNYMHKALTKIKVPLILGVWGGKGQGKTFQVREDCSLLRAACLYYHACLILPLREAEVSTACCIFHTCGSAHSDRDRLASVPCSCECAGHVSVQRDASGAHHHVSR